MRRVLIAIIFHTCVLLAQSGTASIQGTISDATNKHPVAGAIVTALRSGLPPASQYAKTGADGSFDIGSLPAGDYTLCVQVPGKTYLDLCQWSGPSTKVTLVAGQKSTGNAIKIGDGSILSIRIADPGHLINQKTNDGRDPHMLVGVWEVKGLFHPAQLASKDDAGLTLQLTIPRDSAMKLNVMSRDLKLSDANGVALNAVTGDQQAFQHNTGDPNPKSFKYSVTGVVSAGH